VREWCTLASKTEAPLARVLNHFTQYRDSVRNAARTKQSAACIQEQADALLGTIADTPIVPEQPTAASLLRQFAEQVKVVSGSHQQLLALCDQVRNDWVPVIGVRFEDDSISKGRSEWKLDDVRATLRDLERRRIEDLARAAIAAEKERKKIEAARLKAEQELAKAAKLAVAPAEMFRQWPEYQGKFSEYDEAGIPTVDADGKAVSKGLRKKLEKAHQTHTKDYEKNKAK
jgi:cysteinyl-tRNA synthetase